MWLPRDAATPVALGASIAVGVALRRWFRRYNDEAVAYFVGLLDNPPESIEEPVRRVYAYAAKKRRAFEDANAPRALPDVVDLVCSGGGFKVCLAGGLALALRDLGVRGERFAGASAGAQVAFLALNDDLDAALRWALAVATTLRAYPFAYPAPLWEIFYRGRARHYGAPRPGRLFASVTEVTKRVLGVPLAGESRLVDAFDDGEDLGEALLATAAVPWLLAAGLSRPFRGKPCLDGGLTRNCPHFRDGARPQLVVSWDELDDGLCARTAGLYFSGEEMVELAKLGIDAAYDLAAGGRAPCVALVPAGAPAASLPAAVGRGADRVALADLVAAALATYVRPLERRAIRRASSAARS